MCGIVKLMQERIRRQKIEKKGKREEKVCVCVWEGGGDVHFGFSFSANICRPKIQCGFNATRFVCLFVCFAVFLHHSAVN